MFYQEKRLHESKKFGSGSSMWKDTPVRRKGSFVLRDVWVAVKRFEVAKAGRLP